MGYIKPAVLFLLFSFLITTLPAQVSKYDVLWKKTDSLSRRSGLTASALKEVANIYAMAKKENNDVQLIKALIYRAGLEQQFEENALVKTINELEAETRTAKEPALSIINSLLAEKYWNYLQQHRWQLYGRTETSSREGIEAWSVQQFHKRITERYLASLKNETLLQQTPLNRFDPIIIKGNARELRPTLFDLLAHRAIDYFRNEERDITRPAYAFYINEPAAFGEANTFISHRFVTSDSLSLQHKALELFQRLLRFHAADANPAAFIDADIHRIQFVKQYGQLENKDNLYLAALKTITNKFPDYNTAGNVYYLIAQWHADKAASYHPLTDTSNRFEYIVAKEIAEKILQSNNNNDAASKARQLLTSINSKSLQLVTERVNIPGQPFRTLVRFRNLDTLHLRIVQLTDALRNKLENRYDDTYWQQVVSLPAIKSWSQPLPGVNDYQQHSVEIKVDALPTGSFMLLSSSNENFARKDQPLAVQYFHVSNISYVNKGTNYFLLHRETGKPLAGATMQVWNYQYDYNQRRNILAAAEKLQADENGFLRLKGRERANRNIKLEITYQQDRLFEDEHQYEIYRDAIRDNPSIKSAEAFEKANRSVFFFTDRSIYRPGQKLYFKGIAITRDFKTRKNKIVPDYRTSIKLYNANGELIDSLHLTTNEFGSYNGSFQLPENLLNGNFRLHDETFNGETNFLVEEYKRPKFFVAFEELKGTYKLNDSIQLSGYARAYAGNNLNGATVTYTVVREQRIFLWRYERPGYPHSSRMQVAHGTSKTDAAGNFAIRFKAIPDLSIDSAVQPVFDYKVIANITDINGETRTGEKIIPVSNTALLVNINLQATSAIAIDSFRSIKVSTTNLNGQPETSLVTLQLFRLQAPERMIRKRYWQKPDLFIMSKETYISHFPHDEYQDETAVEKWARQEKVFERADSSGANTAFQFTNIKLTEGWYVVEAITTDKSGKIVKDVKYLQLFDYKNNSLSVPAYTWNAQRNDTIQPGGKSVVGIGSAADDLFVIQNIDKEIERDRYGVPVVEGPEPTFQFLTLNKEKKWLEFTASEDDKGGFGVYHFFVKNNRFYILQNIVSVPWSDKELSVSYESFRDKTLPGSEEKWKVRISGYRNEKVAAELLASMYDASLDQFHPHEWMRPSIWPVYSFTFPWNATRSFSERSSIARYTGTHYQKPFPTVYDRLLSTDINQQAPFRGHAISKEDRVYDMVAAPSVGNVSAQRTAGLDVNKKKEDVESEEAADGSGRQELQKNTDLPNFQLRKNFNETSFFIPDLKTDPAGNIEFSFTIPEALTKWKFQALAHSKELAFALSKKEVVTQKDLMVQPNAPRFLREGDRMELSTKIVNLSEKEITGTVQLELLNASTMQPVDGWFQNAVPNQYFTVEAGGSAAAAFRILVPYQYNNAVVYRFTARSVATNGTPAITDGEEAALPVLTNSMLVTETISLPLRGTETKNFRFEKLLNAASSETLNHHALTVEYTSNPAWIAVQALPYLAERAHESADHIFNRFYANALAFKIANSSPRIKEIFERWKEVDTAALLSNLQKNQELKSVLLTETPWVLAAKTETEQRKNIALLFDMVRMSNELASSLAQVKEMQSLNGGFMWFKGGPDDRYITQAILSSIGKLKKLDALPFQSLTTINQIVDPALKYLDDRIKEDYDKLLKQKKADLTKSHLAQTHVHYLYMRSFFNDHPVPGASFNAVNYYRKQTQQYWLQQSRYMQGMIALSLTRSGDKYKASQITRSLKENSIYKEEMGRYWKDNTAGYYWYQAPVETQSLLIEAFTEIDSDSRVVNELKTWLLKQKQTQHWKSSKATADACYALLITPGSNPATISGWLTNQPVVEITLGDKRINSNEQKEEAGTGYFKKTFDAAFIKPQMGNILVTTTASGADGSEAPSWGAVYWQYFERLDKITTASTPLKIEKKLFVEKNTDRGALLQPVTEGQLLKTGDKIKVRILLSVDRNMEYVHMKDMRASCMEPVNVLSAYKWQGGLGYYETTKDASTSFYFTWLPKGSYVFEYPLFVTHTGNFSNGITSVQSMYAPEFASHSEGIRVNVE